jgi:hypothetical protein
MVLLPDPDKYKPPTPPTDFKNRTVFFAHPDLDEIAKHFIGNNERLNFHNLNEI